MVNNFLRTFITWYMFLFIVWVNSFPANVFKNPCLMLYKFIFGKSIGQQKSRSFNYYIGKIFRKTFISDPLICTRT